MVDFSLLGVDVEIFNDKTSAYEFVKIAAVDLVARKTFV